MHRKANGYLAPIASAIRLHTLNVCTCRLTPSVRHVLDNLAQSDDTVHLDAKTTFHLHDGTFRNILRCTFLTVKSNHNTDQLGIRLGIDDVNGLVDRSACRNHIIHNKHAALQGSTNEVTSLTVCLSFLAVEAKIHVATVVLCKCQSCGGNERNTLSC